LLLTNEQRLRQARHWVFDLDGTLTCAEAASKRAWLLQHEEQLALSARAAPGAVALIRKLQRRGCLLGILTRNSRDLALLSLQAIGLEGCFTAADVIGRDELPPKPDPAGLLYLAAQWRTHPQKLVMVGDYRFDLECAKAAGSLAVLVGLPENPWPELADVFAEDCKRLMQMLS